MKQNELMTGDYFYRPDCVDRAVEIRKNGVIGVDSLRGLIPWSEISPITTSPEILETNAFRVQGHTLLHRQDGPAQTARR